MIIPNKPHLSEEEIAILNAIAAEFHCKVGQIHGEAMDVYPIIGDESDDLLINRIEGLPFVDHVARVQEPYKLMSKGNKMGITAIRVGKAEIGKDFALIAGACTIDPKNPNFYIETAFACKEAGARILRGGVWKPRTNPHTFQGDDRSLQILMDAKSKTGLPVNTEVMDERQMKLALDAGVDMLQIGARNALNYSLLKAVGAAIKGKPVAVILKRSIHAGPMDEFISAAEYIVAGGNPNVALCPRGTVPKVDGFRYNPDDNITILLKKKTWAPVVVDPSHAVGNPAYVPHACLAAAAYGADGVMVEAHVNPKAGLGDDPKQAVTPELLAKVYKDCQAVWRIARGYS